MWHFTNVKTMNKCRALKVPQICFLDRRRNMKNWLVDPSYLLSISSRPCQQFHLQYIGFLNHRHHESVCRGNQDSEQWHSITHCHYLPHSNRSLYIYICVGVCVCVWICVCGCVCEETERKVQYRRTNFERKEGRRMYTLAGLSKNILLLLLLLFNLKIFIPISGVLLSRSSYSKSQYYYNTLTGIESFWELHFHHTLSKSFWNDSELFHSDLPLHAVSFLAPCDQPIPVRIPDLVLINKKWTCHHVDKRVSNYFFIRKLDEYMNLAWEQKKLCSMKVKVESNTVVALEIASKYLKKR